MLKAAFYEKDITPPLGCHIPGYFRQRVADDVLDNLYVKSSVFQMDGNTFGIIAIDAVGLPDELHDEVTARINAYTGVSPDNVLVCATHSHTGAPIRGRHEIKPDHDYIKMLYRMAADCFILAYKRLVPCSIKYAAGNVENVSFVRNYKMKDGTIRTNPGVNNPDIIEPCTGPDTSLPVLFAEDEAGKPVGAIINFACHQDCTTGTAYSGDYSSIMSKELKRAYGDDFVSVYIPGTCGNINHVDIRVRREPDQHVRIGKIIAEEAKNTISKAAAVPADKICVKKEYITVPKRNVTEEALKEARETIKNIKLDTNPEASLSLSFADTNPQMKLRYARDLVLLYDNDEKDFRLCIQAARIGDIAFFALPGEIFVQFGKYIKENSPYEKNFIATLANCSYYGYVPVREVFDTLAYEGQARSSTICPEGGYMMADKALELIKKC